MYINSIQDGEGIGPLKGPAQRPVEPQKDKPTYPGKVEPQKDRADLNATNQVNSRTLEASKLLLESIPDVRLDKIELARRRLADGFYDQPEIRAEIAAGMISDPESNPALSKLSAEETEEIGKRLQSGYYDNPEIREDIAKGMIDDAL